MKRLIALFLLCVLMVAVLPSSAMACYPGKVTFGGWQHRLIGEPLNAASTWSYSGNAIGDGTGAAKGKMEMQRDTNVDYRIHAQVVCLAIEPDETAWIGAVVLTSTDPAFPAGTNFVVECQDWGEGANAVNDRTSDIMIVDDAWEAFTMPDLFLYGWSGGNVQMHVGK